MTRRIVTASLRVQLLSLVWLAAGPAGAQPLDLQDPTPRSIQAALNGVVVSASFAIQGNTGVVTLSAASHEQSRPHFLAPVPGSFTPLTLTIDLADGSGTSSVASGAWQSGPQSESFTQGPLSTEAVAGYVQSTQLPQFFCQSQQELNDACLIEPLFCGAICVIVPGSRFDALTGEIVMVGSEEQAACDGAVCFGPFLFLGRVGPILTEAPAPIPALRPAGRIALGCILVAAGWLATRRPHRHASVY